MALLILVQDFNEQDAFYKKNYTMKPCTARSSFILYKISASKEHFCEKLIAFDAPGATWVKNLKNLEKAVTLYSFAAPGMLQDAPGRARCNLVQCIKKIFNY